MPKSKLEQNLTNIRQGLNVATPIFAGSELTPEAATEKQEQATPKDQVAETTAAGDRIDWGAIADGLSQNIENIKSQIVLLEKEITVAGSRVRESKEALELVASPPKWLPQKGEFELFDQLQRIVAEQESEQERQQKLEQVQKAIALGESLIQQKQRQIVLLESELKEFQEALHWTTHYAPHVEKFESYYRYPDEQQREIERHAILLG